jgi:hypothetical protein
MFSMHHPTDRVPSLVVDVSAVFERKRALAACFPSQFHDPASKEPATNISSADFFARWEARHRWFGERIGVSHGEPWFLDGPVPVDDPVALLRGA